MLNLFDSQRALFILVPGFIAVLTARALSNLGEPTGTDILVLYLAASIVSIGIALFLTHLALRWRHISVNIDALWRKIWFLLLCSTTSVLLGVSIAVAYEGAWLNRIAAATVGRIVGKQNFPVISPHETLDELIRTASLREVFPDNRIEKLQSQEKVFRIHLKDGGGTIVGWALRSTHSGDLKQIYLSPACMQDEKQQLTPVSGPGIWVPLSSVIRIDVLDARTVPCEEEQRR